MVSEMNADFEKSKEHSNRNSQEYEIIEPLAS